MLALQCVCKRFAHLGIKAHCVGEINEPAIKKDDLLIVGSGSGGSLFPLGIAKKARETVDCTIVPVSYTHLDVYKRQLLERADRDHGLDRKSCDIYDFSVLGCTGKSVSFLRTSETSARSQNVWSLLAQSSES